jgi:hypothetical protein
MMPSRLGGTLEHAIKTSRGRIDFWQHVFNTLAPANFCEIGVYEGFFAEKILSSCASLEKYYMIDPWKNLATWNKPANQSDGQFAQIHATAMQRTERFADVRHVLRGTTKSMIHQIPDHSLDAVYIDGDHTLRGITIDLALVHGKTAPGGYICGDDFTRNIWQHGPEYDPSVVFPYATYFAEAHDLPIITLPWNQFMIINDSAHGYELLDLGGYADLGAADIYLPPPSLANLWQAARRLFTARR